MSEKTVSSKPLALAVGAAFAGTLALSPVAGAADNPFGMTDLGGGYQLAQAAGKEGACGGKVKEGACGGKMSEGACGGKMKEGACGGKMKEGACGASMEKTQEKAMEKAQEKATEGAKGVTP